MLESTPANIEAVAQRLYRQHRARNGFPNPEFGEWDRAGSHRDRFRADARDLLSVLDEPRCRHNIALTDLCLHADSIANQTTHQSETLNV
jgi:hypothetical protein